MTKRLEIRVSIPHPQKVGEVKELFRTSIETESRVSFEFSKLIDAFNILFPYTNLIIQFTLL